MSGARRTRSGLAGRILRLTLMIGVLTVVAAAVVAVVSTERLSSRHIAGRDLIVVQLIQDRIEGRLKVADLTLDQVAERIQSNAGDQPLSHDLTTTLGARSPLFEQVDVADRLGVVVATSADTTPSAVVAHPAFQAGVRGEQLFTADFRQGEGWGLWGVRAVRGPVGEYFVLAKVDTSFLDSALAEAAAGSSTRRVLILEGDVVIAHDGSGDPPNMSHARWQSESATSGRVTVSDGRTHSLRGLYADLQGQESLPWRLVVLEHSDLTLHDTWRAVLPPVIVLLVGGTVALIAASGVSSQVVRPLRELERAAKGAAAGAYVQPIAVPQDDELGRVADAFNMLSLRLNALHDVSQLLASANQLDQVLDEILSAVGHLVGPGAGVIYLLDDERRMLVPAKVRATGACSPSPVDTDGDGWLARALLSADPLSMSAAASGFELELPGMVGGFGQALAAPLVAGNEPLGVVVALRDDSTPLTDAEREMVRTFSAQAAVAVQLSRLFEQESRLRRVAETLRDVAEQLVRHDGLHAALPHAEKAVATFFAADEVCIIPMNRAALALPGHPTARHEQLLTALSARAEMADGSSPVLVRHGDGILDEYLGDHRANTMLAVPVGLGTDHGAIMVIIGGESVADQSDWPVAMAIADELALAFDNAYFYERALNRAANLETIFRISQAVGSSLQINVVLNRVLDVVQKILSADAVALLEYDAGKAVLATSMARGDIPMGVVSLSLASGEDLPGRVLATGQPASLGNLHPEMEGVAGLAAENGQNSLLAVPLMARGRPIGVLMVFSNDPSSFSPEDSSVLQTFATQAALAIDTARLYGREHEVASVLQASIVPEDLPDFPEIVCSSVYVPAGGESDIGGDYYDLFRAKNGDVWFAIADVCGKGVRAATKTSMIKYAIRALVAAGLSPCQVVSEVNRMVSESGTVSDIVTVWVGRIESPGGSTPIISWANGGHPPGLLKKGGGDIVPLSVTGPLLGAMADAVYEEMSVPLQHGDSILLYTDGVTEARRGSTFFGEQRVRESLAEAGPPSRMADDLLQDVRRFASGELKDDVAVLAVTLTDRSESADEQR